MPERLDMLSPAVARRVLRQLDVAHAALAAVSAILGQTPAAWGATARYTATAGLTVERARDHARRRLGATAAPTAADVQDVVTFPAAYRRQDEEPVE